MGKIPLELKQTIARNIRECRKEKFPGRGGGKKCAAAFGVSPQQWSPWEKGKRTPDESRLQQMADFFGVTVEHLRRDNRPRLMEPEEANRPVGYDTQRWSDVSFPEYGNTAMRSVLPPDCVPGSPASFFWLFHHFVEYIKTEGVKTRQEQ